MNQKKFSRYLKNRWKPKQDVATAHMVAFSNSLIQAMLIEGASQPFPVKFESIEATMTYTVHPDPGPNAFFYAQHPEGSVDLGDGKTGHWSTR